MFTIELGFPRLGFAFPVLSCHGAAGEFYNLTSEENKIDEMERRKYRAGGGNAPLFHRRDGIGG